jgi:hypothetical protein
MLTSENYRYTNHHSQSGSQAISPANLLPFFPFHNAFHTAFHKDVHPRDHRHLLPNIRLLKGMLFAIVGDSKLPIDFLGTSRLTTSMGNVEELGKCSLQEPSTTLHRRLPRSLGIVANIFLATLDWALMRCAIPRFGCFSDDPVYARILVTGTISAEESPIRVLHKPVLYFRNVTVNVTLIIDIETLMLLTLWLAITAKLPERVKIAAAMLVIVLTFIPFY